MSGLINSGTIGFGPRDENHITVGARFSATTVSQAKWKDAVG